MKKQKVKVEKPANTCGTPTQVKNRRKDDKKQDMKLIKQEVKKYLRK